MIYLFYIPDINKISFLPNLLMANKNETRIIDFNINLISFYYDGTINKFLNKKCCSFNCVKKAVMINLYNYCYAGLV